MSGNSWVTLATNDSYALGALVLAHSLKRVGTVHTLTVMITPGVSASMRNQLESVFNVMEVNILDSKDEKNLALLTRPELGITFTKLHCWRLTQFSKCVFLDADVLVLQNCDELFDREELSAAADVGWPDCFNSGVFVYRPSIETYNALVNFALSQGSFDGGDQGLLNQFFSDWSTKDISRHLPFIYNMCSSATYSYLPAFKQYGKNVKIVHFIGSAKPWLQYLDSETRQVKPSSGSEHLVALLQLWWDIFCHDVHSKLSSEMAGLAGALSHLTLGVARSAEQIALEEHLRKQAWEHGNIDYMGRDSFDNIWRKICQTLAEAPSADTSSEQSKESSQVSSVVTQTVSQGDAPADDTSPLPESVSLSSEPKESNDISTDAESLFKKLDVTEECPVDTAAPSSNLTISLTPTSSAFTSTTAISTSSIPELSQVSIVPPDSKIAAESESMPVTTDSIEVSTPSALISTQSEDVLHDPQLKETKACETGGDSKSSHEDENQEVFPSNVIPQQDISQVASELKCDLDSQEKTTKKDVVSPIESESTVSLPIAAPPPTTLPASTTITVATETTTITTTSVPKTSEISSILPNMEKGTESTEILAPAVVLPETEDVSCDSQLKETVTCKPTGTDHEFSLVENREASQNIVIPQQEDSQITSGLNLELQGKPEGGVAELPVETAVKEVTMKGEDTSLELVQTPTVTDTVKSASSELLKQSSGEKAEPTEAEVKIFSLPVEESVVSDADVQSGNILDDTRTPLSEISSKIVTVPSDPRLVTDLASQTLSSQSDSTSASDTVTDPQTVTVIEPTPPTSPLDCSATEPSGLHSVDTLTVHPSIPDTPPVGSDVLPADVPQSTTSLQSSASASVASPVVEGQVSAGPHVQTVDPKAPIPPKRRHKQSQNPDQSSGSKPGKSSTKTSKGKK